MRLIVVNTKVLTAKNGVRAAKTFADFGLQIVPGCEPQFAAYLRFQLSDCESVEKRNPVKIAEGLVAIA